MKYIYIYRGGERAGAGERAACIGVLQPDVTNYNLQIHLLGNTPF